MSKNIKSLLDPNFRYTPSSATDLRKTFARVRREQRLQEQEARQAVEEAKIKVAPMRKPGKQ